METGKKLVTYTNIIAFFIAAIFTIEAYIIGIATAGFVFLIIALLFGLGYVFTISKRYQVSKLFFIFTSNLSIFSFDAGIYGNSSPYIFYIPLILSYFIIFNLKEWGKILFAITFSIILLVLANTTNISPGLANTMPDEKWLDYILALLVSISVVLVLVNSNRLYNSRLRRLAEESRRLHAQLRAVFDNGIQSLVLLDKQYKVVLADKKSEAEFFKSFGLKLKPGMDFREILKLASPNDTNYETRFAKALQGKKIRVERKLNIQGNTRWIEVIYSPILSNKGTIEHVIFGSQDITDKKLAQQKIENNEKLLASLNENIQEGLYRSTPEKGFIYANKAFVKMLGYNSPQELFEVPSASVYLQPGQRAQLIEKIRRQGYFKNEEVEFKRKDGSSFWALSSSILSYDDEGVEFYDGAVRDITDQKIAEQEIIRAKEKAEAATKAKNDFLSAMSHEIRTPMHAIIGFTSLLMQNNDWKKEDRDNLTAVQHSAENLLQIINDILDFSKIEVGKITIEKIEFNLRDFFKDLNRTLIFIAQNKSLQVNMRLEDTLPDYIVGDPVRLNQILLNLCGNAIKFTDKGGVDLIVALQQYDETTVTLAFTIKDTGIGIPEDKLDAIFESFTQAEASISRRYGGTGLGLTITKKLVELQNGTILVKSQPGHGSEFIVTLPFGKAETQKTENSSISSETLQNLQAFRLLLVEDNKVNIMLATHLLKRWKANFDVAENGVEAIEKMSEKPYDLVLLDLQMPYKNGFETFEEIRDPNSTVISKTVPVIAITADAFDETRERIFNCGINDYSTKPFNADELYGKIQYWLQKKTEE